MTIGLIFAATLTANAWTFSVPDAPYTPDREFRDGVPSKPVFGDREIRFGTRKVTIDGKPVLGVLARGMEFLQVWGFITCNRGYRSPWFFTERTPDEKTRTYRRVLEMPAAQTVDGKPCRVESDVRILDDGKVEMTIFNPGPEPKRGCCHLSLTMPTALWHDQLVAINGSQPFRIPSTAEEWCRTPFPAETKVNSSNGLFPAGTDIAFYRPDGRTLRFALRFGENLTGGCIDRQGREYVRMEVRLVDPSKPAKLVVDLGDTRMPRERPHIVSGIDFKEENDFDVACWDESRNLFVNGSFESGTRYWKHDIRVVEGDAHTGRFAMSGLVGSYARSVGTVLKPNTWYTVGLWAKAKDGKRFNVGIGGSGTTGFAGFLKDTRLYFPDGEGWQYQKGSFRTLAETCETVMSVVTDWSRVLIDDICLVEGSNTVATATNPWGLEIQTGAEDNLYVPDDRKGGKIQLVVRGPKGAKAKLDITGSDLLGRKTIAKKASVTIPDSGETLVDLGKDEEFPKGVNGIKVKLNPVRSTTTTTTSTSNYDSHPYTDYLRFNKAHWGDNRQKHRLMQSDSSGGRFVHMSTRIPDRFELELRRDMMLGMGALNYTASWDGDGIFTPEERAMLAKYRLEDWYGSVLGTRAFTGWDKSRIIDWKGTNILTLATYSPEFLKWYEDFTYSVATSMPWQTYWTFQTEPAGHFASLKTGRVDEYVKFMGAVSRGLKRANPKNELCPYGTWNMGMGTLESAHFFAEQKRVDPAMHYKYIEAHSYRAFPEDPDLQKDIETFYSRLHNVGCDDVKIKIGEGSYYIPMCHPSKGIYPWNGVGGHDQYAQVVVPSYDLGYGEKIGAALSLRETAIYYRNADRIFNNCSWNPRWIDQDTPVGWLLGNVALLEMLGDSKFLGEVCFSPKSRAMFFDDGHGALVAFMWRAVVAFDRGMIGPVEAEIDFGDLKPEFYDMYANRCAVEGKGEQGMGNRNGVVKLPLSGYPIYIKLPKGQVGKAKAFKRAIAETLVRADLNKLPLSCALTLKDPSTVVVRAVNEISRTVTAQVRVNGVDRGTVSFPGMKSVDFEVKLAEPVGRDAYAAVRVPVEFTCAGKTFAETFETSAVAVGHVAGDSPDWASVPAVDLADFSMWQNIGPHKSKKDFSGTVKLAWNEKHLWMRFNVKDDVFMPVKNAADWKAWGSDSDMIHLYFDGYANGREEHKRGQDGYDYDDFVFGVYPLSKTLAKVTRIRPPDHQLTGGAKVGFVKGPEEHVVTQFAANEKGYELTLDFPAYYMMPVKLEAGGISPGFAISVYDRDQGKCPPRKAVKNYSGPAPDEHPENWPQLIFVK